MNHSTAAIIGASGGHRNSQPRWLDRTSRCNVQADVTDDLPLIYTHDPAAVNWARLKDDLTADDFDNGRTPDELRRSFENSAVVVFAWHGERVIGKARALSDGVCNAYVVDVWTHSDYRRRGIATRMMNLLADRLPGQHIYLFTDAAEKFYHSLGYRRQGVGMSIVSGQWLNRFS